MKLLGRKPERVRTWRTTEARWAFCPTCNEWLDDRDCSVRRAVLVHKHATGHLPQLFTQRG